MNRLTRTLVSLKTTAALMLLLAVLLLLNVAIPQADVIGEEPIRAMIEASWLNRFVLETLGFAHLSTSPFFLFVVGLFFVNLIAVLIKRSGPTFSRIKIRPPSPEVAETWSASPKASKVPLPQGFSARTASQILRGYGYRPTRIADRMWWGIKHRTAPMGFLIFHVSFFFLCAGGALIYYTRFVAGVRMVEGQTFDGYFRDIVRQPPLGIPPPSPFSLIKVEPTFERGEPIDLRATIRPVGDAGEMVSWVNHPAKWGSQSVLVTQAGVAPELWLQDSQGFTLDRISIAAPTRSQEVVSIPLVNGEIVVELRPIVAPDEFPSRDELASTPIEVRISRGDTEIYSGSLRQGEWVIADAYRLAIPSVRYWAGFMIVDEKGGSLLIIGFVLGVIGATWRMLTHRREVILAWDDEMLRLAGRSEFFPERFADELSQIRDTLIEQNSDSTDQSLSRENA